MPFHPRRAGTLQRLTAPCRNVAARYRNRALLPVLSRNIVVRCQYRAERVVLCLCHTAHKCTLPLLYPPCSALPSPCFTRSRYANAAPHPAPLCHCTVSPNFAPPWPRIVLPHPTGTIQYHALPYCCITAPAIHCLSVTVAAKRRLAATRPHGNPPCYACATPSGTPPYRRLAMPCRYKPHSAPHCRYQTVATCHTAMTTLCNTCTLAALYPAVTVLHGS